MSMTGIKIAFSLMTLIGVSAKSQNIIPDWKDPFGLTLVYPKELRSSLTNFYKELIKSVLTTQKLPELTLIVRPTAKIEIENYCKTIKTNTAVRFFETDNIQDIWVRDFSPIYFNNKTVCKALYNPSYFKKGDLPKYADPDNQVGIELADYLKLHLNYFIQAGKDNLVLDGGNFIHNGNGTAIVTNRVIADNENISLDSLKSIFKSQLNISTLILVPVEPGDETGHIDGMVRFANEQTVFVASYPDKYEMAENNINETEYKKSKLFLDNLADTLSKTFKIIRIENAIPKDNTKFPSAFGNYINFLRIGDTIYLPQYNIAQDKKVIDLFNINFPYLKIIPIRAEQLSKYGGVLNCISWTYY